MLERSQVDSSVGSPHDGLSESRRLLSLMLVGYLLFVIYGSLVPLHFVPRPLDEAVDVFRRIPFLHLGIGSRADWVANFLLFIPLGFVAGTLFAERGPVLRRILVLLALASAGIALAVAIEFTQIFFPGRTVSQNDIFAEGLGGIVGLVAAATWGGHGRAWLSAFWRAEVGRSRARRLLHLYLLVLFAFSLMPLDLTLSPVELFHKWRAGRVVLIPFSGGPEDVFEAIYGYFSEVLLWLPAGWLWVERGRNRLSKVVLQGLSVALAIELAQLFVFTRVTDITDVFLAGLGAGIGGALGAGVDRTAANGTAVPARNWRVFWWAWVVVILLGYWYPFGFSLEAVTADSIWKATTRVPFATYYYTSEYHALNELLRRVITFFPGGVLLGMAILASGKKMRPGRAVLAPALVALVVEAGQLLLPDKVADLTDWLLECVGAWLGLLSARWIATAPRAQVTFVPKEGTRRERAGSATPMSPIAGGAVPSELWWHVAWIAILAVLIGVLVRLPGIPYNIKELVPAGIRGVVSCAVLALTMHVTANLPLLRIWERSARFVWMMPLLLAGLGIAIWMLLRVAIPVESMHDVVGSPVLAWPWELELLGRFLALYGAVAISLFGGTAAVRLIVTPAFLPYFLSWAALALFLSWPLHTVVVTEAATDNLIELMHNGGGYATSVLLACGLFLLALGASAMSALLSGARRTGWLVISVIASPGLAALAFWFGQERVIVKYGHVFSAAQFLLSSDRTHYVDGAALLVRFALVMAVLVAGLAFLQWPAWRSLVKIRDERSKV